MDLEVPRLTTAISSMFTWTDVVVSDTNEAFILQFSEDFHSSSVISFANGTINWQADLPGPASSGMALANK
jgi:hypothetical protein